MCWMRSAAALDIVAQTVVAQTDDDRTVVGVRDSLDLPMASLAHAWRWFTLPNLTAAATASRRAP